MRRLLLVALVVATYAVGSAQTPALSPLTRAVLKHDLPALVALLAAGEDPDRKDESGATPWMWAITFHDREALPLLLQRVERVSPDDVTAQRRLLMAASVNDTAAVEMLLNRGAPVDVRSVNGDTALLVAASSGSTRLLRTLLDHGANPRVVDRHGDTPLMAAVRSGAVDTVRELLRRPHDVEAADEGGRTALIWAARSGRVDLVQLLLESGAVADRRDATGQRAIDHAALKRHGSVVNLLRGKGSREPASAAPPALLSPRAAVEKSLPLLQQGARTWDERRGCGSCHHRQMIVRTTALAKQLGFPVQAALVEAQLAPMAANLARNLPRLRQQVETEDGVLVSAIGLGGDGFYADAANLVGQIEAGLPKSDGLETRALLLARKQQSDGRWRYGPPRVPILSSDFTTTAYAVRAISTYGAVKDAGEMTERVARARRWLQESPVETTDDRAGRLLGLRWAQAEAGAVGRAADELKRQQNSDGGWPQLPGLTSDAYATGLALAVLHTAGTARITDAVYRRGVDYLLRTQEPDGSWLVHKRAAALNEYFESGFPHGKFQFISYAGTCWATMALMYAATQ